MPQYPGLPKAVAARQPAEPADYVDEYAPLVAALQSKMSQPAAPMYTPEQVAERRGENERQYALGMLGQLSGHQSAGDVGGLVLKQALANRAPRQTERGIADPISGQFTYDPEYLRQRDEGNLQSMQVAQAKAKADWLAKRQGSADRQETARLIASLRPESSGQVGAFQPYGTTNDGKQVVTNTKSGVNYILNVNPDGTPNYTPFMGAVTPKATFEKNVASATEAMQSASRADKLLTEVGENPEAFGLRGAAVSSVPGAAQSYAAMLVGLTPAQLQKRADLLRAAAMEINTLYGAALSGGEEARASSFVPNAQDTPETIMAKLGAARDWARSSATMHGQAVTRAASERTGGAVENTPGAAPNPDQFKGFKITRKPTQQGGASGNF